MIKRLHDRDVLEVAKKLAVDSGVLSSGEADTLMGANNATCARIKSDGSTRRFWRIYNKDKALFIVVAPDEINRQNLAEAKATWEIGNHLLKKNIPVPQVYNRDKDTGVLLFEDLGTLNLHKVCTDKVTNKDTQFCENVLSQVVEKLALMQFEGIKDFNTDWCWDTPVYDYSLMVEREARYFLDAFWRDYLGQAECHEVLAELEDIAQRAQKAPAEYLLHRDFQSRNIMVKHGKPYFIDFQGARTGPLGYDLASLLIDPYSQLSLEIQEKMMALYLQHGNRFEKIDSNTFHVHYNYLAVQRNLQIIGAFAFLYNIRGKIFFRQFLKPALILLRNRLDNGSLQMYKHLRPLVDDSLNLLD